MVSLSQLQRSFQDHLLTGNASIGQSINHYETHTSQLRLAIYRTGYQARLIEQLVSHFPYLYAYLGVSEFQAVCLAYIDKHPSSRRTMHAYGEKLPDFLTHFYPEQYAYRAELAWFEWQMMLTFEAADHDVLPITAIDDLSPDCWDSLVLHAHPSVRRLIYKWNVIDIWENLANHHPPLLIHLLPAPEAWVLWRYDYFNRFYRLNADESWAIDAMLKGYSFGMICEGLSQWHDLVTIKSRAAYLLQGWIQSGLITRITL